MPGLPTLASAEGGQVDFVILLIHIAMLVSLVGWGIFFVVPLWRFRESRPDKKVDYIGLKTRAPLYAVAAMAVVEMVILIGWSLPFWENEVAALPEDEENAFRVRIVAQQFQWNIHYPGIDGIFGRTDPGLIDTDFNLIGLDPDDPNGKDDITSLNQFHIPIDRLVIIHLTSKDVIHSLFLPEFRVKQDAIPGMNIPVHFVPTMSTEEFRESVGDPDRDFEIACAQLSGLSHYTMRGFVTVETEEEFQAWYETKLKDKQEAEEDAFFFNP